MPSIWARMSACTRTPTPITAAWRRILARHPPRRRHGRALPEFDPRQMVEYFRDHSNIDEPSIQAEVGRYIAWPSQALAYKIGQLKILELRDRAKKALGDKFDIRLPRPGDRLGRFAVGRPRTAHRRLDRDAEAGSLRARFKLRAVMDSAHEHGRTECADSDGASELRKKSPAVIFFEFALTADRSAGDMQCRRGLAADGDSIPLRIPTDGESQ